MPGKFFDLLRRHRFLFEELVKRDFKRKYKRTILGMGWSVLSPLLTLFVMKIVFSQFFGREMSHYTIYLFCGNLVFSYYKEATSTGMGSLLFNAAIFTKINVPKYIFLLSRNVSSLINFGLTFCVFILFCALDKIDFSLHFLLLIYPVFWLLIFNIGIGFILSALYVFFRDIQYLYDVFTMLLMYMSAIFYNTSVFSPAVRNLFLLNPVYVYISYFREVVLNNSVPSVTLHLLCVFYAVAALAAGVGFYKKFNKTFLYYV